MGNLIAVQEDKVKLRHIEDRIGQQLNEMDEFKQFVRDELTTLR